MLNMEELRVTVTARYTLSIPNLSPVVGLRNDQWNFPLQYGDQRDQPGSIMVERLKKVKGTVQTEHKNGCNITDHEYSDANPKSVLSKAVILFKADYYEGMLLVLGKLDLHLILPDDYQMAKEFGCGLASKNLGKHKNARNYFTSLMKLASSFDSNGNYALACWYLGDIEMSFGNFVNAKKHYANAVQNFIPNTVAAIFEVELSESMLYIKFGQCQKALKKSKDSMSTLHKAIELASNKEELLEANMHMGHACMDLHDYKQSLHYYKESLRLSVELGDHKSEGLSHGNIGRVLLNLNEKACALEHLITAYQFSAKYECNSIAVGRAVSNLANGYAAIDDINKALEYYKIAHGHFIYARDLQTEGRACGNIGNMHMLLKDYEKAIEYYEEALTLVSDQGSKEAAYHNRCLAKFEIAVAQKDYVNALVLAEETRARTVSKSMLKKKATMYSKCDAGSNPMTIEDIYKTVTQYKVPVIFMSYCISKLLIWILVPIKDDTKLKCCSIQLTDFGNSSFEQYIQYRLLEVGFNLFESPSDEQKEAFTKLYDRIGKEIEKAFKDLGDGKITEFIFIPDNVTHLLPLSAMLDKQTSEIFGDQYRIRIYPSILSLQMMGMIHTDKKVQISSSERDCLVVGNPKIPPFIHDNTQWNLGRLPYAELEAKYISNILNVSPLLREQATKYGVIYRIRNAKIIHIATHGSGSTGFLAFSSSFPLSKDGCAKAEEILIYPSDIEGLNISPTLVVLSSCQANRGSNSSNAVMGMAGAFLCAGAHSVLVSSFSVADESTCVFMELFYHFLMDGFSSSHALQKSTQCMRCIRKFSGFNHWAGFQLIGQDISICQETRYNPVLNKLLGKTSIFPSEAVENIKHGLQNSNASKIQLLTGLTGSEPDEPVKDYIKKYYHLYSRGVYWFNATDELMLEASVKLANADITMCEDGSADKRLVVIDNISRKIKLDHLIDSSTDVIIICSSIIDKNDFQNYIEEVCYRPVNTITVKNLTTTDILKTMTYGLLRTSSFLPKDSHIELFSKLSGMTMGSTTLTNIITAMLMNYNIDEVSTKINNCVNLCVVEKELYKSSPVMLLTCSALIKSIISPEAEMLLNSLITVGIYGVPIPSFIIKGVEKLILSDSSASQSSCFKELEDFSFIRKYPHPCMYEITERTPQYHNEFYYIPKLICDAMWEENEKADHLLNVLILLKAIKLHICENTSDRTKLELMFGILTTLHNHTDEDQLLSNCIDLKLKIAFILHCNAN